MPLDFTTMSVKRIIFHFLPQLQSVTESKPIRFSEIPSPLDPSLENLLTERIKDQLQSANPLPIIVDSGITSLVPKIIWELLHEQIDFVEASHLLAQQLYDSQRMRTPAGMFILLEGLIEGQRYVSMMKQELSQGIQLQQAAFPEGQSYHLNAITDLLFINKNSSFKFSLFPDQESDPTQLGGILCEQSTSTSGLATKYFLCDFLGCKLQQNNPVNTRNFYLSTHQFITDNIDDSSAVFNIGKALINQLQDSSSSIDPIDFSNQYLPDDLQEEYINFMEERKVPLTTFPKDISLLENSMNRIRLKLESGLQISGDQQTICEALAISNTANGEVKIEIVDKIKHFETKRGALPI